jgi:hypothetical protein
VKAAPRRRRLEVHVYRDVASGKWDVASGRRRLSRHRRPATAVRMAQRTARRRHVDLVIHGRNGRFRSKNSYGNESPRLDREH